MGHSTGLLGAERSLLELVSDAVQTGDDPHVALPGKGPLTDACQRAGASTLQLPAHAWMGPRHGIWPIGAARLAQCRLDVAEYVDVMRKLRPDAVITNTGVLPAPAFAARALGIPHVWFIRETVLGNRSLRSTLPKRSIARRYVQLSDIVACVSSFVARQLRLMLDAPDLPLIVASPRIAPLPLVVRRPHSSSRGLEVLVPGFVSQEKGQVDAVEAFAAARRRGLRGHLTLVGSGRRADERRLARSIAETQLRQDISWLPFEDDLSRHFDEAHVVVVPSHQEAFGRVTLEAMAHGLPVIGYDSGGTKEILSGGGGVLVQRGDIPELARGMLTLARDPAAYSQYAAEAHKAAAALAARRSAYSLLADVLQPILERVRGAPK